MESWAVTGAPRGNHKTNYNNVTCMWWWYYYYYCIMYILCILLVVSRPDQKWDPIVQRMEDAPKSLLSARQDKPK